MQITTRFVLYLKILIDKIKIFDFFFLFFKGEKKSRKRKEEKPYGLSYGHNIIVYAGRLVLKKNSFSAWASTLTSLLRRRANGRNVS